MAHISTTARKYRKRTRQFIHDRMNSITYRNSDKWSLHNPVTNTTVEMDALGLEGMLYSMVPSARECEYKYGLGVARLLFTYDQMNNGYKDAARLNDIIKIITSAHSHEWDSDLRGMETRELVDFFYNETKMLDNVSKNELSNKLFVRNEEYEIRFIPDFETAQQYKNHTSWCITSSEAMWKSYSDDGLNNVYFIAKKGFETVEPTNENAKDEYGLSLISVIIRPYGSIAFCTGRYNHSLGGNDSLLNALELSELIGANLYELCPPKNGDEIEKIIFQKWTVVEPDEVAINKGWKKLKKQNGIQYGIYCNLDNYIYTYYDPEKQYLVFDKVKEFDENGLAIVELNRKFNLINKNGDLVL